MYLSSVPRFLRVFMPSVLEWEIKTGRREIFLTFDDGPIPEVTPWVLNQLDNFGVKATFFCVGDNVRKHPEIFSELISRNHKVGNHSFNHIQAWKTPVDEYLTNVELCKTYVKSELFRPPHGQITPRLARILARDYRIIMWSALSRDFDRSLNGKQCLDIAIRHSGCGSIVVFHDSVKARERLEYALPRFLEHFSNEGYSFSTL